MMRNRKFLAALLLLVVSVTFLVLIYPNETNAIKSMWSSIIYESIFNDMLPYQERIVSEVTTDDNEFRITVGCVRQPLFTYSVYLNIKNLRESAEPLRVFVAEKDFVQDCNEYVIEEIEVRHENNELIVKFRNDKNLVVDYGLN